MEKKTIGYVTWNQVTKLTFYVSETKGKVGDWGYTSDASKAINLSPYWQKRFAADQRYCGRSAQFLQIIAA